MRSIRPRNARTDAHRVWARAALIVGLCATAVTALLSRGVYHEDDLHHFLIARWSWHDVRYLLDEWGRPGFTVLYALPSAIGSSVTGFTAARLLSVALSGGTAWLCFLIARQLRLRHAWLAIPLVYLQPLFTRLASTTLTETPLAFYFALATWLLLTGRCTASAVVMGLGPLARHEAIVLLPIWAIALWQLRARWWVYALLGWGIAAHNLLALPLLDHLPIERFLHSGNGESAYGRGTPLTFLPRLLLASGAPLVALALFGIRRMLARTRGWIVVAAASMYFATETGIYFLGAYASGGYARFLVPMAPWMALLALAGAAPLLAHHAEIRRKAWAWLGVSAGMLWALCEIEWYLRPPDIAESLSPWVPAMRWVGAALVAISLYARFAPSPSRLKRGTCLVVAVAGAVVQVAPVLHALLPMRLNAQQSAMRDAVEPLLQARTTHRTVVAPNFWIYHFADEPVPFGVRGRPREIFDAPRGALFVWDAAYCAWPGYDLDFHRLITDNRWALVWAPDNGTGPPRVAFFERR